jgi:hypothetical protein
MKDLNEIKAKYSAKLAEELELAELSNKYEKLLGIEVSATRMWKGIIHISPVCEKKEYGLYENFTTPHIGGIMLRSIKPDEKIILDDTATKEGSISGFYKLTATRGFSDSYTLLKVEWISEGITFSFSLKIDGEEILEPFFFSSMREMSSSERSTYKPVTRYGHIAKTLDLPIMRFHCSHITFSGGYLRATDVDEISKIIEAIKNA